MIAVRASRRRAHGRPRSRFVAESAGTNAATDGEPVIVTATTRINAPPARVFAFHADARNLPRLMGGPVRLLRAHVPSREGDAQIIRLGVPPLAWDWHARIAEVTPPSRITDVQEHGPFRFWRHTHLVIPAGDASLLVDSVAFRLVPGRLGRLLDCFVTAPALRLLFAERHRRTRCMLGRPGKR